ncbi:MAG: hypothetical protein M0P50_15300, partial [Bacteroidales bacterium]|nr:hypothetical protein [Bacteroidales bacterium]
MIRDFTQTVEQLKELAKIINEFQSEAVQLKLIELLFSSQGLEALAAPPAKERKARATTVPAEAPASESESTDQTQPTQPTQPT